HVYCVPATGANCSPAEWDREFGLAAAHVPVLVLEFGERGGTTAVLQRSMLPYVTSHGLGMFAYAWCRCDNLATFNWGMLARLDGTPSAYGRSIYNYYVTRYPLARGGSA